jgi:hypothetical protein
MNGKAEVHRLKQKLDATFERIQAIGDDLELKADFAKYLCVLVSGYLEKAVVELVQEHARRCSAPSLQRFVEQKTRHFTNANAQKLQGLLGSFDPDWRKNVEGFLVDELKDAVDSIVALRNTIAHGNSVSVTYHRVSDYYQCVQQVIDKIADLCVPT